MTREWGIWDCAGMKDGSPMSEAELVGPGVEGGIPPSEVIPALLQAAPSLAEPWREHLGFWGDDERGMYNDASVVAGHLVDLLVAGNLQGLSAAFAGVEALLARGDRDARAMLIVGVIEGTQNISLNRGRSPEEFNPFLSPETAAAWNRATRYWQAIGAQSLADVVRWERGVVPAAGHVVDPAAVSDPQLRRIVEGLQRPPQPTPVKRTRTIGKLLAKLHLAK